jgi:hypothetical protein
MSTTSERPKPSERFGILFRRGYAFVAFRRPDQAERARRALVEGGYAEDDLMHDWNAYRQQALGTIGEIGRISLGRDELQP